MTTMHNEDTPHQHDSHEHRSWFEKLFHNAPQDQRELLHVLKDALHEKIIDKSAYDMMEGALNIANQQVRDIMVSSAQVVGIQQDQSPATFLPIILEAGHSRFPIFGEGKDDVVGILLAKDVLRYTIENSERPFDIKKIMRPALFVPESKRLDALLADFRKEHYHLAIVVDEYGGFAGIVTIEDILEEIVGEIEDEFDTEEQPMINPIADNRYQIDALTEIEAFNDYFHCQLSDEQVDTIGGLVSQALTHMPKAGETITIDGFEFIVTQANRRKVIALEVIIKK